MALVPYAAGAGLAAASGLVRAYRRFHPYYRPTREVVRRIIDAQPRDRNYNIVSRFQTRLGPTDTSRPYKRRRVDPPSRGGGNPGGMNNQREYYVFGNRRSKRSKREDHRLLKTVTVPMRWRFQNVSDLGNLVGANCGAQAIGHFTPTYNSGTYTEYPLHLLCVTDVMQTGVSPYVSYALLGSGSSFLWKANPQVDGTGATTYSAVVDETQAAGVPSVGRRSYLDWFRLRLNLWGKNLGPTTFKIRLCRFTEEECCPQNYTFSGAVPVSTAMSGSAPQMYQKLLKNLINNPISSLNDQHSPMPMKVLDQWIFTFNPGNTTDRDTSADNKVVDIFKRVGRLMDYGDPATYVQSVADLDDPNKQPVVAAGYTTKPSDLTRSLYFMITCDAPRKDAGGYTNPMAPAQCDYQNCYDVNLQVNHTTVQPAGVAI